MKFTLSWLKEHLDTDATLDEIVTKLTMIGLEVESVEDPAKKFAPFKVVEVISAVQHPNADRLRVCMVNTGEGAPIQIVCGAPNARGGMKAVLGTPGTYIPAKNITLSVGKIRGVESHGMLISGAEVEFSDDHDGIIEMPADAPIGKPFAEVLGLNDPVIEINLTPNRADCTAVSGIARDLGATGIGKYLERTPKSVKGTFPCPVQVKLDFGSTPSLCPGFALRLVRGVKNGPSPEWLQKRLTAIGLRPINALVDITNFMTFDRGRPLHVFDARKVHGNLTVRRAKAGEELLALDGKTYKLDESICVIADEKGVESLAGIMGGELSGCDETTTDVLIESALWEPINIAQTGRKLGINSDARYRFERGVDPNFMVPGLELATQLVLDLCGGEPSENVVVGGAHVDDRPIEFPVDEVKRLAGLDVSLTEMKRILGHLGFFVAGSGKTVKVAVPSWRADVEGKADIVEEIVRIVGVDEVPLTPFERGDAPRKPVLTTIQNRTRKAKRALAARALAEAVTWSFIAKPQAELFGGGQPELALANPIASDLSDMRPSLIPGLVAALQRNVDRGLPDVGLFEVGQIFKGDQPEDQFIAAAGLRHGLSRGTGIGRTWIKDGVEADTFDAKADALAVLAAAGAPMQALQIVPGGPAWLHPGRSGTIQMGPKNVFGYFGELHPRALEALKADGPIVGFEVILDRIPEPKAKPTRAKPLLEISPFQPVSRDFAFLVDSSVKADDVVRAAQNADKKLITGVTVFDVYEGKGVEPGKKSLAIAVTIQPRDKTMTDQEIDALASKVVADVTKRTGGTLRA
ncbi:phenylalanine--tRNA ligase subunit beta [Pseudorhodoplanes sinuspersici]|uniref:Phenylalanine--tRNA ligase beta subunit n=1 Tax=Pseudorhodoplanes sinuspersici TaxID=1235591 RepID=A0A1W6ZP79_9HYPH|nr:phenylalanine--tRNA ligase subunit beta [Pseudorhodoplanes sinuspersici]ARP99208.1 phenylalanine--tRNA ligase subunit beta [Pseudorhodoplanes sinuspersici]RKE69129.1 phenylalanyl-tRNA synthetase beta subunit [Pseudorhodoplanes sinuspersici]